ncbi:MAG: hypothetical protein ACLFSI_00235 [Halorhodospira sp.]
MLAERVNQWEQQWKHEGEAGLLLWQLEQKFGQAATEPYRERLEQADEATIRRWSVNILTAERIKDVFGEE